MDSYATSEFQTTRSRTMEVHRIGHVNHIPHYVRKSEDAQIVAGFTFYTFSKKVTKVLKTCSKTGILNVCMLKPNAIIGGSFWRSFQIHKNQVLKNTVDRTRVHPPKSHSQKSLIIRTPSGNRSTLCARTTRRFAQL